jgi:hypothetical protein
MQRWSPRVDLLAQEKMLMKRLTRVRTLFGFLRLHRHELFDDSFQEQLEGMYRTTGEPASSRILRRCSAWWFCCKGTSERRTPKRWSCRWWTFAGRWSSTVWGRRRRRSRRGDCSAFRERMIAHDMDRVLLDRTVALVRSGAMTEAEGRSLSKALRAAIDSRPLAGAGRLKTRSTFSATPPAASCTWCRS